jgi:hypothetical protein
MAQQQPSGGEIIITPPNHVYDAAGLLGVVVGAGLTTWIAVEHEGLGSASKASGEIRNIEVHQSYITGLEHDAKTSGNVAALNFLESEYAKNNQHIATIAEQHTPGLGTEEGLVAGGGGALLGAVAFLFAARGISNFRRKHPRPVDPA